MIRTTRLKFFGHVARANPSIDHSRALRACVAPLPRDWNNRRSGRPRHTWLQTVEPCLAPLNFGLATAYRRAQSLQAWRTLVGTATSSTGQATRWWWWCYRIRQPECDRDELTSHQHSYYNWQPARETDRHTNPGCVSCFADCDRDAPLLNGLYDCENSRSLVLSGWYVAGSGVATYDTIRYDTIRWTILMCAQKLKS